MDKKLDDLLVEIEFLFQKAINELKEDNKTEIDFEYLCSLLGIYRKFYETQETNNSRWNEYTIELGDLLRKSREDAENTLKKLLESDKALTAYQNAQSRYLESEE